MFELSVAFKYLVPRWRQLSVSIISIISILVISLVVWLILVFFSVTDGLEKRWIEKLTSLTAPIRLTPTAAYYESYYYRSDSLSASSDYGSKSIGEKLASSSSDPYNPLSDQEIPSDWPLPLKNKDGTVKDIVKETFTSLESLKGRYPLKATDYEMTVGNIRLRLIRDRGPQQESQTFMSQASYLNSFDGENRSLQKNILPITPQDLTNALQLIPLAAETIRDNGTDPLAPLPPETFRERVKGFFNSTDVKSLAPRSPIWNLPSMLIPVEGTFEAVAITSGSFISKIIIPSHTSQVAKFEELLEKQGFPLQRGRLTIKGAERTWNPSGSELTTLLDKRIPLAVAGINTLPATLRARSIEKAQQLEDILFRVSFSLQNVAIQGETPFRNFSIASSETPALYEEKSRPLWLHLEGEASSPTLVLPKDPHVGEGILLAKSFRESGVLLGDRGFLSYYTPTASSVQEQRIPVYVAGFYDPGIIPIGGRFITVSKNITSLIRSVHAGNDSAPDNGINVRFDDLDRAEAIKAALVADLEKRGIAHFWKVETFREFEFTKDLIQQLKSDKNLFSLISMIIIIVACSNIISMLIILVNDKKTEIGILRSMGATSPSIAAIFGLCGIVMGFMGSLIGTVAAIYTLKHIDLILGFLGAVQGFDVLNTSFYGTTMPQELSYNALSFVLGTTAVISLLAGIVPAIKASLLHPSRVLRSE